MAESIVKLIVDATQGVRSLGRFKKATNGAKAATSQLTKLLKAQSSAALKVKAATESAQGGYTKLSQLQGVLSSRVLKTERAISAQISALRDVRAGLKLNGPAYKRVTKEIERLERSFERSATKAEKFRSRLGGLQGAILSLGVAALTKRMIGQAASFQQTQIRLKALSAEYGEFSKIQQLVKDNAKTFNLSQAEASSQFSDIYARLRPLGKSLDEVQTVYKGFNATAIASGTSAAAASGAFLQLSQALGSGRLQGDEFRSVSEQIPGILGLVADEMGVTVDKLKKLGSEGKITSDILINSLAKGFEKNKDKIQQILAESPAAKFKEFSNATSELSNAIGTELLPAVTPVVQELTKLLKVVGDLPGPIKTAGAAVLGLTSAVVVLAPLLGPAAKGFAAIKVVLAGITGAKLLAAGPWFALAAGIAYVTKGAIDAKTKIDKLEASLRDTSGTGEELKQKMQKTADKIKVLKGQLDKAGPSSDYLRKKIELLTAALDQMKGRYKIEIAIDEIRNDVRSKSIQGFDTLTPSQLDEALGRGAFADVVGGSSSTGSAGPDPAIAAEELLERQLKAGAMLSQQFTRQVRLREASSELAREELQIEFARQDAISRIAETAEISQQAALKELANKIAVLDVEKARGKVAAKQASDQQERDKAAAEAAAEAAQRRLEADPGFQMRKQFEELIKLENQAAAGATATGSAFSNAFVGVISGAKSAQEGLAEMMQSVAKHFLDMAAKIIAQQTAMILYGTIMKALGISGGGIGFNPSAPSITGNSLGDFGGGSFGGFKANGGPVSANTPYIVGERGPELMVPSTSGMVLSNSETREQLGKQQNVASTREQLGRQQNVASTRQQLDKMMAQSEPLNIRYESTVINNVEYVTAEQHRQGMAQAAERGRAMTLTTLQNSPRTRSKVGI